MSDWFDSGGTGAAVDAPALLDTVQDPLAEIVACGALVSLSLTSDGGALGITITVDGRWRREYFRSGEEALDWLLQAVEPVRVERERVTASRAAGKRPRRL